MAYVGWELMEMKFSNQAPKLIHQQNEREEQSGAEDIACNEMSAEELLEGWEQISAKLRKNLGEDTWRNWLRNVRPYKFDAENNALVFTTDARVVQRQVMRHYSDMLRTYCQEKWQEVGRIIIEVKRSATPMSSSTTHNNVSMHGPDRPMRISQAPVSQNHHGSSTEFTPYFFSEISNRLDPKMSFTSFVRDKTNDFAYSVAKRMAEDETPSFNPLFIYGGVGLGKTHLLHSIAGEIRALYPSHRLLYLSSEAFAYRFVKALRDKDTVALKEGLREVDVFLLDDIQFICGKKATQEEFFHTFNALSEQNKKIIITADKSPADLPHLEERLRSRLNQGMVTDIRPTTFALRMEILRTKADERKIIIPQNVLEFLAERITSNIRILEGALNRIAAHATIMQGAITIENVSQMLTDLLKGQRRSISIADIQKQVAQHYGIRLDEMQSNRRSQNIVKPRQIAMYLAKEMTSNSYPEIGRHFGGRDHTTVMHAARKIEKLILENDKAAEDIATLKVHLAD